MRLAFIQRHIMSGAAHHVNRYRLGEREHLVVGGQDAAGEVLRRVQIPSRRAQESVDHPRTVGLENATATIASGARRVPAVRRGGSAAGNGRHGRFHHFALRRDLSGARLAASRTLASGSITIRRRRPSMIAGPATTSSVLIEMRAHGSCVDESRRLLKKTSRVSSSSGVRRGQRGRPAQVGAELTADVGSPRHQSRLGALVGDARTSLWTLLEGGAQSLDVVVARELGALERDLESRFCSEGRARFDGEADLAESTDSAPGPRYEHPPQRRPSV